MQNEEPQRIEFIEYLDANYDLFNDAPVSNLIGIGFIDSIQDDLQLLRLINETSTEQNRNIVCQYFICQYIPTSYEVAMKMLRLFTGREYIP